MVRRIFVHGLSSFTSESTIRSHFEQFGELYECILPPPAKYSVIDTGPDDEEIEKRSEIRYEKVKNSQILDEELTVEPFSVEKHGSFEKYMRKIGEGDSFVELPKKHNAGYAFITFIDVDGFLRCMREENHEIDQVKCVVELAKQQEENSLKIESKRLFVSFFPLDRLSAKELKTTFGAYGKITDVEFVSDNEGPLHFCIITFEDAKSVDVILTKSIFIRDVRMFTRRAVLKEFIKMAEHRQKEAEKQIQLPVNHTAYPARNVRITGFESTSTPTPNRTVYDRSAAAGYASIAENDSFANYGYGPRQW